MNQEISELAYHVGSLLYMPALQENIASKIMNKSVPYLTSAAFCLEDTILDEALEEAEQALCRIFSALYAAGREDFPLLFIRIRSAQHMQRIFRKLGRTAALLTGFILPKFDLSNADDYLSALQDINQYQRIYAMPILESRPVADMSTRQQELNQLYKKLMSVYPLILNIRVGGNDFCNLYGLRRTQNETIYQIGIIRDILADILNRFSGEFVVSAPVWEYFGTGDLSWAEGMKKELSLDRLNGFIGKTAIHPSQLRLIWESLKVSEEDYCDACRILDWQTPQKAVQKGYSGSRMNERNCHGKWAKKIKILGDLYGVRHENSRPFFYEKSSCYYSVK